MQKFPINEIFGATIQGEGIHAGRKAHFVRFQGCDSACDFCDTEYAIKENEENMMSENEILSKLLGLGTSPIVVLTGGNPLLRDLDNLCQRIFLNFSEVHIETQGTIFQEWLIRVSHTAVSPKAQHLRLDVLDKIFHICGERSQLKVVIFSDEDMKFAKDLHQRYLHIPLILQPGYERRSSTTDYILNCRKVTESFISDSSWTGDVRVMPQLHRIIFDAKRGV